VSPLAFLLLGLERFLILIFFPGKKYQQTVKQSENNKRPRMRMSESMDLIDHEGGEHKNRQGIGPQLVEPKADYQHGFNQTMREEIERSEHGTAAGQFLRSVAYVGENEIMLITSQFVLAERLNNGVHRGDFEPQQHAAGCFEYSVNPFQRNAYTKRIVNENVAETFSRHLLQAPNLRLRGSLRIIIALLGGIPADLF
jgi:hypothetical protein